MLYHIDYIANLVGVEHLALGPDFVDYMRIPIDPAGAEFSREINVPDGFENVTAMPNVTAGLVQRRYDEAAIRGILGGNFLRVFERVAG
jgi:membrane dipeptidase